MGRSVYFCTDIPISEGYRLAVTPPPSVLGLLFGIDKTFTRAPSEGGNRELFGRQKIQSSPYEKGSLIGRTSKSGHGSDNGGQKWPARPRPDNLTKKRSSYPQGFDTAVQAGLEPARRNWINPCFAIRSIRQQEIYYPHAAVPQLNSRLLAFPSKKLF